MDGIVTIHHYCENEITFNRLAQPCLRLLVTVYPSLYLHISHDPYDPENPLVDRGLSTAKNHDCLIVQRIWIRTPRCISPCMDEPCNTIPFP
jgi:hypothetical protein